MARLELRLTELEAKNRELLGEKDPNNDEDGIYQVSLSNRLHLGGLFMGHDPEIGIVREQTDSTSSTSDSKPSSKPDAPKKKSWYDKISLRGYTQLRYSDVTATSDGSAPAQHVLDRSIATNQSFLVRRARVILSGDVHEHVYVYFQPDFAVTPTGNTDQALFVQMRDVFADYYIDDHKEYRIRGGLTKVPYGWENMQSSSNRIPFERTDAMNSATPNERDLGVYFYYTPTWAQDLFKDVVEKGLKGTGNYGLFAFGTYAGQGGAFQEQNDHLHLVTRLAIPHQFCNGQYVEAGLQAYQGKYTVLGSGIRPLGAGPGTFIPAGTSTTGGADGMLEERVGATFVWYPQPIGFQAEWNVGRGPGLNDAQTAVQERSLYGGYAMVNYKVDDWHGTWFPYARWSYYQGGYKSQRNAPYVDISEWEFGTEWQINPAAELTLAYLITDRTNTGASTAAGVSPYQQWDGQAIRLQFQFNY